MGDTKEKKISELTESEFRELMAKCFKDERRRQGRIEMAKAQELGLRYSRVSHSGGF